MKTAISEIPSIIKCSTLNAIFVHFKAGILEVKATAARTMNVYAR